MQHSAHADDLKLTRNQSRVLSVLQSTDQPLSAYTILARLRDDGINSIHEGSIGDLAIWPGL